mmetsp:Transcript_3027/g.8671  ORF Transcript_3027/g.8671 Transcript_3027/m.8671 type:complete len:739 (+) Transcript_3027:191-2407(+)
MRAGVLSLAALVLHPQRRLLRHIPLVLRPLSRRVYRLRPLGALQPLLRPSLPVLLLDASGAVRVPTRVRLLLRPRRRPLLRPPLPNAAPPRRRRRAGAGPLPARHEVPALLDLAALFAGRVSRGRGHLQPATQERGAARAEAAVALRPLDMHLAFEVRERCRGGAPPPLLRPPLRRGLGGDDAAGTVGRRAASPLRLGLRGLRQPHQLGAVRLWRPQRLLLLVHLAERAVDAGRRCRRQAEPLDGATDGVVVVRRRLGLGRPLGLPPPLRLHRPPLYRAPDAARRARQPGQAAGLERARRVAGRQPRPRLPTRRRLRGPRGAELPVPHRPLPRRADRAGGPHPGVPDRHALPHRPRRGSARVRQADAGLRAGQRHPPRRLGRRQPLPRRGPQRDDAPPPWIRVRRQPARHGRGPARRRAAGGDRAHLALARPHRRRDRLRVLFGQQPAAGRLPLVRGRRRLHPTPHHLLPPVRVRHRGAARATRRPRLVCWARNPRRREQLGRRHERREHRRDAHPLPHLPHPRGQRDALEPARGLCAHRALAPAVEPPLQGAVAARGAHPRRRPGRGPRGRHHRHGAHLLHQLLQRQGTADDARLQAARAGCRHAPLHQPRPRLGRHRAPLAHHGPARPAQRLAGAKALDGRWLGRQPRPRIAGRLMCAQALSAGTRRFLGAPRGGSEGRIGGEGAWSRPLWWRGRVSALCGQATSRRALLYTSTHSVQVSIYARHVTHMHRLGTAW